MKAHRRKRLLIILAAIAALGAVAGLILYGLQSKVDFFLTPADITAGKAPEARSFRLGGLVKAGSFRREPDSLKVYFTVADNTSELAVTYDKILPDLFREGQGVIADGQLNEDGVFVATKIIAKHDENYMSPQLKKKTRRAWPC